MKQEELNPFIQKEKVCEFCLFENEFDAEFCDDCGVIFEGNHHDGSIDNLNLERKYHKKSNRLMLIGSWLLFLPLMFLCIFVAVGMMFRDYGGGFMSFAFFWLMVGLAAMFARMLYAQTNEYYSE